MLLDLRLFLQGLKPASFMAFYGAAESRTLPKQFMRHVIVSEFNAELVANSPHSSTATTCSISASLARRSAEPFRSTR
jgi:hypothetical protein